MKSGIKKKRSYFQYFKSGSSGSVSNWRMVPHLCEPRLALLRCKTQDFLKLSQIQISRNLSHQLLFIIISEHWRILGSWSTQRLLSSVKALSPKPTKITDNKGHNTYNHFRNPIIFFPRHVGETLWNSQGAIFQDSAFVDCICAPSILVKYWKIHPRFPSFVGVRPFYSPSILP